MAFKFVIISCLVALVHAGNIPAAIVPEPAAAIVAAPAFAARLEEFDTFPQYRYGYSVSDSITGDVKSQTEERNGNLVQGQYSLVDPDGTLRTVDYTADDNGFNAIVRKENLVAQPAVVAEPALVAAEPAVVPARIAAAPIAPALPARYAAAPVAPVLPAARYLAAPTFSSGYTSAYAPFGRLAAAPFAYRAQQVVSA